MNPCEDVEPDDDELEDAEDLDGPDDDEDDDEEEDDGDDDDEE